MTNQGTLDDVYFEWLYSLIGSVRNKNPARSRWSLSLQLYKMPFRWTVRNDDNREEDGKELRYEFIAQRDIQDVDPNWLDLDCSMLEMLIALSRRIEFDSMDTSCLSADWFWHLIDNLGLLQYTDNKYNRRAMDKIDQAITTVVTRTYRRNGDGGLFPLRNAHDDQRYIELAYQMSAYLLERE